MITHKDNPQKENNNALRNIASAIHSSGLPSTRRALLLVHGGGSFGHYFAKKFNLSTLPNFHEPIHISLTTNSMLELHRFVLGALLKKRIPTETMLPSELLSPSFSNLSKRGLSRIHDSVSRGFVPVTFGYVVSSRKGSFVVSGDAICKALAMSLRVNRIIFAMDVDGIYPDSDLRGSFIRKLSSNRQIRTRNRFYDVTGGLRSKIELGFELHKLGCQVFYVNGNHPQRLKNLLLNAYEPMATEISE